jgi:hypothetical protein
MKLLQIFILSFIVLLALAGCSNTGTTGNKQTANTPKGGVVGKYVMQGRTSQTLELYFNGTYKATPPYSVISHELGSTGKYEVKGEVITFTPIGGSSFTAHTEGEKIVGGSGQTTTVWLKLPQ